MDLGLAGKSALVTGSSAGIGLAIAGALHREGASVLITGRDRERLENARRLLNGQHGSGAPIEVFAGDMTDAATVDACVAYARQVFGRLDVLVANVGGGRMPPGFDAAADVWDGAMR